MPAKSKVQQRFMAMCLKNPGEAKGSCPDMSKEDMRDFARTKHEGLKNRLGRKLRKK